MEKGKKDIQRELSKNTSNFKRNKNSVRSTSCGSKPWRR